MAITIPTTDGPMTLWEPELEEIQKRHPSVDVVRELERFAEYIGKDDGRRRSAKIALSGIEGWLKRAVGRGPRPMAKAAPEVEVALAKCIERGLVPVDFQPQGEDFEDQMRSLEAQATIGWYRLHPSAPDSYVPRGQRRLWDDDEERREESAGAAPKPKPSTDLTVVKCEQCQTHMGLFEKDGRQVCAFCRGGITLGSGNVRADLALSALEAVA